MTSVVICTYNRASSLPRTLHSLAKMKAPAGLPWELIVVDNNSADRTPEVVREFGATAPFPVRYVFEGRPGLSQARNTGIASAAGDIIIFTDDDVTVDRDWLAEIVRVFAAYDCAALGGKVVPTWECPKPRWFHGGLIGAIVNFDLGDETMETRIPGFGANMAFRRSVFEEFGFFRTDLGRKQSALISGEDTEFFQRLIRAKARVVYAAKSIVYHPVEQQRIRKAYFRRWYFGYGRSRTRGEGIPANANYCFGAPRYFWRRMATEFFRWLISLKPAKRFYNQMQFCVAAGAVYEARRCQTAPPANKPSTAGGAPEPAASVVIATRNRSDRLRQCLTALEGMAGVDVPWEILVVDNNSTDATRQVAQEFDTQGPAPVRYLFDGRRGKSAALNTGILRARGAIVAFTDDDCIPDRFWLTKILAAFRADPDLAVLGGRVELYNRSDKDISVVHCRKGTDISRERIFCALFGGPTDANEYGSVIGANMAARRETFARIGLFDLFLAPGSTRKPLAVEDCDFAYRACRVGLKVAYSPRPLVYHNHGRRTEAEAAAVIQSYNRGRGAFYFKHCFAGDVRVIKAAYWEAKEHWKRLSSHGLDPVKRKDRWRILRALVTGMTTQFSVIGRNRMGKYRPAPPLSAAVAGVSQPWPPD